MNIQQRYPEKCSYQSFKGIYPQKYVKLPEWLGKAGKWANENISTPEQKLFLATSALMFQPLMDLKFAQEDKKVDAAIKSAAKAMAGGFTGVLIRAFFIDIAKYCIRPEEQIKVMQNNGKKKIVTQIQKNFWPKSIKEAIQENKYLGKTNLAEYNKTLGTICAILCMVTFTNKNFDVPLTNDLQDLLSKIIKEKKPILKSIGEVGLSRKNKIDDWLGKRKETLKKTISKIKIINDVILDDSKLKKKEMKSK